MTDVKTTIAGIVAALAMVAKMIFKTEIPEGVAEGITAIAVFAIGFFSKDAVVK